MTRSCLSYRMSDMRSTAVRINARLAPRLARKVAAVQRQTRKTLTVIVRESLEAYCDSSLRGGGSAAAALEANGFVGCAEGPVDLSERYKADLSVSLRRKS